MMTFRGGRLKDFLIPTGTVWLMTDIAQSQGKQEMYTRQAPQVIKALRDMALVQSAESSNRIEGVTVDPSRLEGLILGHTKPRDRSEQEVQAYRVALNLIHTSHQELVITPELLQRLHGIIQEGSGDAGRWKRVENEIIEIQPGQAPLVRFKPVSVAATPAAVEELCLSYRHALDQERVQPLLATAALILDFLCIHPFRDGNGRVGRLLTLLALYHHDVEVGRYISLERLIEESKEDYYRVLQESSRDWHEGRHDFLPWLNYFLTILRRAYREFERRAGEVLSGRGAKTKLLLVGIESWQGDFTVRELQRSVPGVSVDMVRHVLEQQRKAGRVRCSGKGPSARWRRIG